VTTPDPSTTGSSGTPLPAGPPYSSPSTPTGSGSAGQTAAPATSSGPAAPATSSGPPAAAPPSRHTGRTIGRTLAAALLVFVTVVLVLFVMFNTQTVDISLVFTDIEAPLVMALLVAAVLGALVASLAGLLRRARRR
jgi:uncharacterized integral membrane protein